MTLSTNILGIISIISIMAALGSVINHSVHMYVSNKKGKFYPVRAYITYTLIGISIVGFIILLICHDAEGVLPMYAFIIAILCYVAVVIRKTHKITQRLINDDKDLNATPSIEVKD